MEVEDLGRERDAHLDEDRLLDLVLGFLRPAEESACLSHLRECSACEESARSLASDRVRFRIRVHESRAAEGASLTPDRGDQGAESRAAHSARQSARVSWWRRPRLVWAVPITAVAIVILMYVPQAGRDVPDRPEPVWLRDPTWRIVTSRGETNTQFDPDLRAGFEAYGRRDIAGAVPLLERARAEGDMESLRRIYLGSALVLSGESRRAIGVLRSISAEEIPATLRDETGWTLLVALSGAKETVSADSLLTLLGRQPGAVGDRARQLLTKR
jgi:hypothetical protein